MAMTYEDLVRALHACAAQLGDDTSERASPLTVLPLGDGALRHARWMAREALTFAESKPQKAHRWLGFIQGVLWCTGVASIEEMKEANRPAADGAAPELPEVSSLAQENERLRLQLEAEVKAHARTQEWLEKFQSELGFASIEVLKYEAMQRRFHDAITAAGDKGADVLRALAGGDEPQG